MALFPHLALHSPALLPDPDPSPNFLPDALPSELIATILAKLSQPKDLLRCELVSHRMRAVLQSNAPRMARPAVDVCVQRDKEVWRLELSRKGGERRRTEKSLSPFRRFEVANLTLVGPVQSDGLCELADALRTGKQCRIRSFSVRNVHFLGPAPVQRLFAQTMQQNCQRIQIGGCRFDAHSVSGLELAEGQQLGALDSFAQLHVEDNNVPSPSQFGEWAMAKFGQDLRHRMRPHPLPMLWDAPVPLDDGQLDPSEQFVVALAEFILNWQLHPDTPYFNIRLRRCPRHFASALLAKCSQLQVSHTADLVFPSRTLRTARIQGKHNQEKALLELLPVREVPAQPNPFCLIGQHPMIVDYF